MIQKYLISFFLLAALTTSNVKAQGFQSSVSNSTGDSTEETFKYTYTDSKTMDGPIYFFFDYTSLKNTGFEGQLSHDKANITMFHNDDIITANHYVSAPITAFNGMNAKGSWEFHVHIPEGTSITKWGVLSIPEPSTASLLGLGLLSLLAIFPRGKKV